VAIARELGVHVSGIVRLPNIYRKLTRGV